MVRGLFNVLLILSLICVYHGGGGGGVCWCVGTCMTIYVWTPLWSWLPPPTFMWVQGLKSGSWVCKANLYPLSSFSGLSTVVSETGSLTKPGAHCFLLDWQTNKPHRSACPCLPSARIDLPCSDFYTGSRNLNAGPHNCVANTLPETTLQLLIYLKT